MNKTIRDMGDFPNELQVVMLFHMQMKRWPKEPWELTSFEECEGIPLNVTNYPMRFLGDPFSDKLKIQILRMDETLEKMVPFGELDFSVSVRDDVPTGDLLNNGGYFGPVKSFSCAYYEIDGRKS